MRLTADVQLQSLFTCQTHVRIPSMGVGGLDLIVGPRERAEQSVRSPDIFEDFKFLETFEVDGGTLRLGIGHRVVGEEGAEYWERGPDGVLREVPTHVVIWEGSNYSLESFRDGGEGHDLLTILSAFRLSELPDGLLCEPVDSVQVDLLEGPTIIQEIEGVALLDINQRTDRIGSYPLHRGTQVTGGELFVAAPGEHDMYFVLVSQSAITSIIPINAANLSTTNLIEIVANLEIDWTDGSLSAWD